MPKGYWIAAITIRDTAGYPAYQAAMREALAKYGGRYLVRGGRTAISEGHPKPRAVVIEFDDLATAVACYESPEMAPIKVMRHKMAEVDLVVVEGWDGAY